MLEAKITELAMLVLDFVIIYMTRRNRIAIESTKKISKKVYVALDAERVKKVMESPVTSDDMITGQLEIDE